MTVLLSGTLKDGSGGALANTIVELLATNTTLGRVVGSTVQKMTSSTGAYSFELANGVYALRINFGGRGFEYIGEIRVLVGSINGTLEEYLTIPGVEEVTPEILAQVIQLRADAIAAADKAAKAAKTAAMDATAYISAIGPAYPTTAAAVADYAKIPDGGTFYVRSASSDAVVDEYLRNGSGFIKTGKQVYSVNGYEVEMDNRIIHRGTIAPFMNGGTRFGVAPVLFPDINSLTRAYMRYAFLNFTVLGARKGYYYRMSYFGKTDANVVGKYLVQFEELAATGYGTENTASRIHRGEIEVTLDGLVKTLFIECNEAPTASGKIVIAMQVDAKYLADTPDLTYAAVLNTTTAYCWIIDPSRYVLAATKEDTFERIALSLADAKAYTDKAKLNVYPMRSIGIKAGMLPTAEEDLAENSTSRLLWQAIRDIEFFNVNPDFLYRISSWGLSETQNAWFMQVEACSRLNIAETAGYSNFTIHNKRFKPDLGVGIKRYRIAIASDTFVGSNMYLEITLDTDALAALVGRYFVAWRNTSDMFTYYVDPERYNYADDVRANIVTPRHSFGSKAEIASSTRLGLDPLDEMERLLNAGVNKRPQFHSAIAKPISGEISFMLSSCVNTDYDRTDNFNWAGSQTYDLPLVCIDSRLDNSPIDPVMFTPFRVNMSGWLFWTLKHDAPVRGTVKGTITALFRVKDETSRQKVRLVFREFYNTNPNAETKSQTLGATDSGNAGEYYGPLNVTEFLSLADSMPDYTNRPMLEDWIKGNWVKKTIAVSQPVVFYPGSSYSLRAFVTNTGGNQLLTSELDSTDIIVLSGGLSMQYNASSRLTNLFNHRIDGGTTK